MKYERLTKIVDGNVVFKESKARGFVKALQRFAELENKIENGTLVELPCKVGDTIYYASQIKKAVIVEKVTGFLFNNLLQIGTLSEQGIFDYSPISYLGKTMFFTRAEAEAKLKELKQ